MDNDSRKVISALKESWHKMDILYDFYAKSIGLNFTVVVVLELLSDPAEVYTQKGVCEKLGLPKQLINSIIKSLWEQGFVELKEASDRRNKDIIVTARGREYIINVLGPLEEAEFAAWESFSAEEILQFSKTTEKYAKAFEGILKAKKKKLKK